jgi:hypothetical protein
MQTNLALITPGSDLSLKIDHRTILPLFHEMTAQDHNCIAHARYE